MSFYVRIGPAVFLIINFMLVRVPCFGEGAESGYTIRSLDDAVNRAVGNSEALKYQKLNVLYNLRIAKYAITPFIPALSLSFSENDTINIQAADSRSKSLQLSVSQLLFDGGKARLQYDLRNMGALYANYDYEASEQQYVHDVAAVYRAILLQKSKIEIQKELISMAELQLRIMETQRNMGRVLEVDFLEYEISVAEQQVGLAKMERELVSLEHGFNKLLNMPDDASITIDDVLVLPETFSLLDAWKDGLLNIAVARNKSLQRSQLQVLYARKQTEQAGRAFLPDMSLEASLGFSGAAYPLTEPRLSLKLNIAFSNAFLPVTYSHGETIRASRLAGAQNSASASSPSSTTYFTERKREGLALRTGELEYGETAAGLRENVRGLIEAHDQAVSELELKKRLVDLSERRVEINRVRLSNGTFRQIDFLKNLSDLASARISLAELACEIIEYEHSLEVALSASYNELWSLIDAQ
jgi:outer membrane protein TolC